MGLIGEFLAESNIWADLGLAVAVPAYDHLKVKADQSTVRHCKISFAVDARRRLLVGEPLAKPLVSSK